MKKINLLVMDEYLAPFAGSKHIICSCSQSIMWVTDALDVRVSGPSTVRYYGNPQVTQDIARVGRLVQLGEHP